MTGREVMDLATAREKYLQSLRISVHEGSISADFMKQLEATLEPFKLGTCPVKVKYRRMELEAEIKLGTQWRVTPSDELINGLKALVDGVELEF
jgi:DNA polymerase-3 subunit alpha